jgi:hypothetical protein
MKLQKVQIFVLVYFVLVISKFLVKSLAPAHYTTTWKPIFDGMIIGTVAVCILYFAWIFISAWLRNKREEITGKNGVR